MASGDVISGGLQGGIAGASTGGSMGGPLGAVIGGAVGAIAGGILGGRKKKLKIPQFASSNVYGYDSFGNLISRGSYKYNKNTGQYELVPGQLSQQEKAMRQNLGANIANLINTVGSTPDAFVRYAKELSDSYYNQSERALTKQYEQAQAKLDETLARRGMSTSRAAADLTSELQGKRLDTLADIYDMSRRYGYDIESGLQGQARASLGALGGYQGALSAQDQSYLSQALKAQQIGQSYENMKAGLQNKQIAQENQNWQNVLNTMTSIGNIAAYARGANPDGGANGGSSTPWMTYGTNAALNQQLGINQGFDLSSMYGNQNTYGVDPTKFMNF